MPRPAGVRVGSRRGSEAADWSREILRRPRDAARIAADAATMRAEIERHKPPPGRSTSSLGPGGLVDLEFAVHVLQLTRHVGLDPRLEVARRSSSRTRD